MKMPSLSLAGKKALVTGASGGIGSAIAQVLGAAGASVFLHGFHLAKLEKVAAEMRGQGVTTWYKDLDITVSGTPQDLVDAAVNELGGLDILVNSAGLNRPQKPEEVTEKNWDDVFDINLKALFFVCQAAGKVMIKRGGGKIINISSQSGQVALPLRAAYCSSKGGVDQLTRTLALEWAEHGINVNAVAPTFVLTPFIQESFKNEEFRNYILNSIPLGRLATAEEVANAVLFLASDLSSMITGHILTVDGGWTIK